MKIKNLLIIVAIASLTFSACKYEDGPGISLRTKRVRISNEWIVTDYQVNDVTDNVIKSSFTHDSLQLVFTISKNDRYAMNVQYTKEYQAKTTWRKDYVANQTALVVSYFDFTSNTFVKMLGSGGAWSFDKKHDNVNFGAYDLTHAEGEDRPLECKILMLKAKNLKISFTAKDGSKHTITFEPRNDEAGLLK